MGKLTVTHDLQLRGALLRFVARTLPLTHPSGCNKSGNYNKTNMTAIEQPIVANDEHSENAEEAKKSEA